MSGLSQLVAQDVDQSFADWGESVVFEVIETQFNVESGELEESSETFTVQGILATEQTGRQTATAAFAERVTISILTRAAEVPNGLPLGRTRLIWRGETYTLSSQQQSALPGVLQLEAIRN